MGEMTRVSVEEAERRLPDELPKTVVVFGQEPWLKRSATARLLASVQPEFPDLNVTNFEGVPDYALLQAALGKPPFMSPRKAVLLRSTDMLSTKGLASQSDPIVKMALAEGTAFIVEATGGIDGRKPYVRSLEKGEAFFIECAPVKSYEGSKLVADMARSRGLVASGAVASALFERCGGDLFAVENELDKLRAVCVGRISKEELDMYGPDSPEAGVFAIEDLFLKRQYGKAAEAVDALLAREPSPFGFLSVVIGAFRSMLVARTCRDARFPYARTVSLICEATGCRDWQAKKAYERSARLTADRLRAGVEKLARIDFKAKQGELNLRSDLYALLFDLYAG